MFVGLQGSGKTTTCTKVWIQIMIIYLIFIKTEIKNCAYIIILVN